MGTEVITLIVVLTFFVLLVIGLPVAFCLISTSIIYTMIFWSPTAVYLSASTIYAQGTKEIFLAIPLFVFLASILERSGIAEQLYEMFDKWIGRLRGGVSIGSILMCTIMDAISGLGASGIVTIGPIALPEMRRRKYHNQISLGAIASGSALGPLIPPSVVMIIIAGFTGISVGKLFAAGLFPGLICAFLFAVYILVICYIKPEMGPAKAAGEENSWYEKLTSLKAVISPVALVIAIMGSIYAGICTPTEGAAVGAFGALICAAINKRLTLENVYEAGLTSIKVTCMVMWLLIGGSLFASLLNALRIQDSIAVLLNNVQMAYGSFSLLLIIMFIVLIMGMFIDGAAITVITMPVFFPVIIHAGIDPLWFGILFTINIIIGYITPPFGMNLFYLKGIVPPDVSITDIYKSIYPFVIIMMLVLIMVWKYPAIATWFPGKMIVLK